MHVRKAFGVLLISVSLLLAACTPSDRKAALLQAESQSAIQQGLGPVPSAAMPGVLPESAPGTVDNVLTQAKAVLTALDLSDSEPGYKEFRIESPQMVFTCQYSPGDTTEEEPLLACKFGEFYNTVSGHALFWRDGTEWRAQLYPQAPSDAAQLRYSYFRALGENCPIGCGTEFRSLHQSGEELLAVVDLSAVSTNYNQEVHLLKREGQQWRMLWVPTPKAFRFSGHPKVTLPLDSVEQFVVSYEDGSSQTWVRQGTEFIQRTDTSAPSRQGDGQADSGLPVRNGITGQIVTMPDGTLLSASRLDLPDVSSVHTEILGIGGIGAAGGNPVAMAAGNHVKEIRQEEVTLPIGNAYLAVVVRGQPAAANSEDTTTELWLVAVRKHPSRAGAQLAYAIRGVITGDETRAKEQFLELGKHWQLPAE